MADQQEPINLGQRFKTGVDEFTPVDINPSTFFEKAGNYASQGRFQFSLDIGRLIDGGILSGITAASTAQDLLSKGLLAKTASVPASTLATYEEFSFSGPTRKHAHSQLFGPLNIEFLLIGSNPVEASAIHSMFMTWHENIVAPLDTSINDGVPVSDVTAFAVEYYDNYKCDRADLKVLSPHHDINSSDSVGSLAGDPKSQVILSMSFYEIYPIAVGGLSLSWDNEDAPLVLPVTFEYYYMKTHKRTV